MSISNISCAKPVFVHQHSIRTRVHTLCVVLADILRFGTGFDARTADVVLVVGERAFCYTRLTLLVEELTFAVRSRGTAHAAFSVSVRLAGVHTHAR